VTGGWLSPTAADLALCGFGGLAVLTGLLVVVTRQLVHAALWLVVCLGSVAGCFLVMGAQFVAWMQILVYLGAVVVIVLFGFMLTRAPIGPSPDLTTGNLWLAAAVAVTSTVSLLVVLLDGFGSDFVELGGRTATGGDGLGRVLFGAWVLPFEALSVLLLAALVGAVTLSRLGRADES
jgi:NADH-quinone oxidoreductase subunit J